MVNWARRIATITVLIPTVVALLLHDRASQALVGLVTLLALHEYATVILPALTHADKTRTSANTELLVCGAVCVVAATAESPLVLNAALAGSFTVLSLLHVVSFKVGKDHPRAKGPTPDTLLQYALQVLGLVHIVWSLCHINYLRRLPFGIGMQILFALTVWNADNGAIVVGSALGKTKFIPVVSPGKTWAGAIGGVLGSVATFTGLLKLATMGVLPEWLLPAGVDLGVAAALGCMLGVLAVLGDLVESILKRAANVKDSGSLLPGHGGMLDRMDSMVLAAPAMFYILSAFPLV